MTPFRSLIGLVAAVLLAGCTAVPHQALRSVPLVPTPTPGPIRLPADDAPHNDLTEWWYYTGHLTAATGEKYGFEFVIFQAKRQAAPVLYAAHFAITDHQRQQFNYDQRTWTEDASPKTLDLVNGNWGLRQSEGNDLIQASMPGYALNLTLTPVRPPTLHGGNGIISFGAVGESYYYSDTRLAVQGTIDDHGVTKDLGGLAWKDRQWGNFLVVPNGGWDWVSLQLNDGTDLMLFDLRGALDQVSPSYGTLVPPTGPSIILKSGEAQLQATGSWTSPHTQVEYPSGWTINLPARNLHLRLTPVLKDQEIDARKTTGQIYWEGEVNIVGTNGGKSVQGEGYVELTGYATMGD